MSKKKLLAAAAVVPVVAAGVRRFMNKSEATPASPAPTTTDTPTFDEAELGGEVHPDLLKILVDPADKGPLELSADGKFLVNPRNGYRYPIRRGIPVMLLEEGRKYQDPSLVKQAEGEQ